MKFLTAYALFIVVLSVISLLFVHAFLLPTLPIAPLISLSILVCGSYITGVFFIFHRQLEAESHREQEQEQLQQKIHLLNQALKDLTEEKRVEAAKSEFVSLASHQLRTPLTAVSWYTECLINNIVRNDAERTTYLHEVYDATKRMISLVNALLNTSRLELGTFAVEPREIDLVATMKEVLHELSHNTTLKHLHLTCHYHPSAIILTADIDLVRIIFQNVLTNAIKYTHPGGSITVRLEKQDAVVLSVADTGIGIPLENQSKIFTKLFRAENVQRENEEGTGLGLYVVKEILDYVGGSIHFESIVGTGTTFFVTFPKNGMRQKVGNKKLHL